jgi:hypothetical protein
VRSELDQPTLASIRGIGSLDEHRIAEFVRPVIVCLEFPIRSRE